MALKQKIQGKTAGWVQQIKNDLKVEASSNEKVEGKVWSNQDMDPTPPEKRNWVWHNYLLYFVGTGFNNWQGGSSVIGVGLGWKAAIAIAFITSSISGVCCVLNGKAAARYHIGFPAVARTVYGMYGSYYQVAVRAILAAVWYATQMYAGASYLEIIFKTIFGTAYTNIPNKVPESVGYTTQQFLCYFVLWFCYIPFMFKRPSQLRIFFNAGSLIAFPAVLGLFIYCMVQSEGKLGLGDHLGATKMSSSDTAWMVVYGMTSSISNGSPYLESFPDMARWSKTPTSFILPTLFTNVLFNPLSAVLGILGTSALQNKTGETLWKPWDIMSYMLEQNDSSAVRFGVFLLASLWLGTTVSQNISSNLIPFGSDTSMLWPNRLTMTRGFIICHLLAWCICPWKIYASASTFLNFMGAYGVFMGPAVSIMLCEYFLISRGNVFVPSIYVGSSHNPNYWYYKGWNLQAYAAYIIAVGICFIGFVNKVGADVPDAGVKLGYLGWFLTFTTGFICYYVINRFWPHENVKNLKGLAWEQKATIEIDGMDFGSGLDADSSPASDPDSTLKTSSKYAKYVPQVSTKSVSHHSHLDV